MIQEIVDEGRTNHISFDSLHEQTSLCVSEKTTRYLNSHVRSRESWVGRAFYSFNEVLHAMDFPWKEGMEAYEEMITELRRERIPPPQSMKRQQTWSDEEGEEICLDRMGKDQSYMRTTKRQHRQSQLSVTIIGNSGITCDIRSLDAIWRSVAITCLTELLEEAGYRVELWAVRLGERSFFSDPGDLITSTCLKRGFDPLDVSSVVNAFSGWAHRTIGLGTLLLWDRTTVRVNTEGYGRSCTINKYSDHVSRDQNLIQIEQCWSKREAIQLIKDEIEKLK